MFPLSSTTEPNAHGDTRRIPSCLSIISTYFGQNMILAAYQVFSAASERTSMCVASWSTPDMQLHCLVLSLEYYIERIHGRIESSSRDIDVVFGLRWTWWTSDVGRDQVYFRFSRYECLWR